MEIYSYKDNKLVLLQNDSSVNYLLPINSGKQFLSISFFNYEPNEMFLMSYDYNSNTVATNSIIDVSTYPIISILVQSTLILIIATILIGVTFLYELSIDNDSYVSKKNT